MDERIPTVAERKRVGASLSCSMCDVERNIACVGCFAEATEEPAAPGPEAPTERGET